MAFSQDFDIIYDMTEKMTNKNCSLGAWGFGANFLPSNAINQLEMWQADTFSPDHIERELGWAEAIGMTLMRVYLHDLAYAQDPPGFFSRVERYLDIAARHGMRTAFVFFDDCWLPLPKLGAQPEPRPCTHNSGWVQSPGEDVLAHPETWGHLKQYVQETLRTFGQDQRVFLWDLYNEPKPFPRQGGTTNALLPLVFEWAREAAPSQPLTVDVWSWEPILAEINRLALAQSDVLSLHCYGAPAVLQNQLQVMKFLAEGRPVICTEYMARTQGSTFADCLPIMRREEVSAINWGLVAGKSNTIYPYGWTPEKGRPPQWFHDVFNADGTLLYPEENAVFQSVTQGLS